MTAWPTVSVRLSLRVRRGSRRLCRGGRLCAAPNPRVPLDRWSLQELRAELLVAGLAARSPPPRCGAGWLRMHSIPGAIVAGSSFATGVCGQGRWVLDLYQGVFDGRALGPDHYVLSAVAQLRPQGPPRPHHQAGLGGGALGAHRSRPGGPRPSRRSHAFMPSASTAAAPRSPPSRSRCKLLARSLHIFNQVHATTTSGEGQPAGCAR